jgi:hypothetical protein
VCSEVDYDDNNNTDWSTHEFVQRFPLMKSSILVKTLEFSSSVVDNSSSSGSDDSMPAWYDALS